MGFIADHDVWGDEQREAADGLLRGRDLDRLRLIRLLWCDQHGLTRAKAVTVEEFRKTLERGRPFQLAPMLLDTSGEAAVSPLSLAEDFGASGVEGFPDGVLAPDPTTLRPIPWEEGTAAAICDLRLQTGAPMPFCTRQLLRRELDRPALTARGSLRIGLEVEFYVARLVEGGLDWAAASGRPLEPPRVEPLAPGPQYLCEQSIDRLRPVIELVRETAQGLGLPLATIESETGPGHLECSFEVMEAAAAADAALLFRSGVKQAARRAGYHASFMPRPQLTGVDPSGWHLHQSIRAAGRNLFADPGAPDGLSGLARTYTGGLLAHAREAALLYAPLVNSYKRFEPNSFAPWAVGWSVESRRGLVRAIGAGMQERTRLEFRGGDPAANPYLYVLSQIACGMRGVETGLDPGAPERGAAGAGAERLPRSLAAAVMEFEGSALFREALGDPFVAYLTTIKRREVERFEAAVTDWEQREYFGTM